MWPIFRPPLPDFGFIPMPDDNLPAPGPIPLQKISVQSDVKGNIVHSTLEFVYKNDYNTTIETKFRFPVASDTAVYHMQATINGKTITGKVKEREVAEQEYTQAVQDEKTAAHSGPEWPKSGH